MISSKRLNKNKEISHGFFNSKGGISKGIYKSLNCGPGSRDNKIDINKNLNTVCKKIGCKIKNLVLLKQTHSNKFHLINKKKYKFFKQKLSGDALITNEKKIALGILTADCAPIFIYDKKNKKIAAIHSGWKGALKGISEKIIQNFYKNGSKLKNLQVVIGPCISEKNYEVKSDFLKKFLKKNKNNKIFFKNIKKRLFFNLAKFIAYSIKKKGVKNIEIIKKDTFQIKNNFFSSRRALKKNDNDYGRNISVIMIN